MIRMNRLQYFLVVIAVIGNSFICRNIQWAFGKFYPSLLLVFEILIQNEA